jgi:hypothetical protein
MRRRLVFVKIAASIYVAVKESKKQGVMDM